jgi:hypothetical protein
VRHVTGAEVPRMSTGRLFRRGIPPANVPAGTDLSFLLDTTPHFDMALA